MNHNPPLPLRTFTVRHTVSLSDLTVYAIDTNTGETMDLNAAGEPCEDVTQLRAFIRELRTAGAYGRDVEAALLADLS